MENSVRYNVSFTDCHSLDWSAIGNGMNEDLTVTADQAVFSNALTVRIMHVEDKITVNSFA